MQEQAAALFVELDGIVPRACRSIVARALLGGDPVDDAETGATYADVC